MPASHSKHEGPAAAALLFGIFLPMQELATIPHIYMIAAGAFFLILTAILLQKPK